MRTSIVPKKDILFVGISPDLNKDFRDVIGKVKGCNRGSLREATEEAITLWLREERKKMG